MRNVIDLAAVFLGGGLGAVARYGLSGVIQRVSGFEFPYGTLVVNLLGSFLIGVLAVLLGERYVVSPSLRLFLLIGVLGGFTTFSTFSHETVGLWLTGRHLAAAGNMLASALGCTVAAWIGISVGRLL